MLCLIESVFCGSTDPKKLGVLLSLELRKIHQRFDNELKTQKLKMEPTRIAFVPEIERINNVMLKLARGHAAFELSQPCRTEPTFVDPPLSFP